jgi:hypothetical protein
MNQKAKGMVIFSLNYVKNNMGEQSQNVQCRNWIKTAKDSIEKSGLSSSNFILSILDEIDGYFSGSDTKLSSNDVREKINMVESLLES